MMIFGSHSILLWSPQRIVSCKSANAWWSNYMEGEMSSCAWKNEGAVEFDSKGSLQQRQRDRAVQNKAE